MIFWYIHGSIPCSVISRETLYWRCEQIEPHCRHYARVRDLRTLSPKWDIAKKSLPSGLKEPQGGEIDRI